MLDARCRLNRNTAAGAVLPELIRDLHTSLAAGRNVAELLDLAVLLHTQGTGTWLKVVGAPLDLRSQAAALAQQAARDRDEPTALGIAMMLSVGVMLSAGAFNLAQTALDSVMVPTNTSEGLQLSGMLALSRSLVAASDKRDGDMGAALDQAAELAQRTGEGNAFWMGFGPINVGLWRMAGALEAGDSARVLTTAEALRPQAHPHVPRQAAYWVDYGRALAGVRGRHDDAVRAFRRAEAISPHHVLRAPIVRDVFAVLLRHSRRGSSTDEVLRGMARRAGLPV